MRMSRARGTTFGTISAMFHARVTCGYASDQMVYLGFRNLRLLSAQRRTIGISPFTRGVFR
jgi:hypothetical protein